ncbi:MAG: hypothetical protein IKP45_13990 [Bacteroidales bacterium]|nr:hypothetical protein [Bacteroidales bacterium]
MNKRILLVSTLIAMSMVLMFTSCKKDEPTTPQVLKGCSCNILDSDGSRQTLAFSTDEMAAQFQASDCSTLGNAIKYGYDYTSADCSPLY